MKKLWLKYENWSKLETDHHMYRYTPDLYRYMLAQNDQNLTCTGTCSRCTGTCHPKMPRMGIFPPIFPYFATQSTLYSIYTSQPFHIHLVNSIILKSSFNGYLSSKPSMIYSQINSNMGNNSYIDQIQEFVRVCSNPTPLLCN